MSVYRGVRWAGSVAVRVDHHPLPARNDLFNHSPDGFEWGYGGSGPAQLALAILAHHLGDDRRAVKLHQQFKWEVIAPLDREHWQLSGEVIDRWLEAHPPEGDE